MNRSFEFASRSQLSQPVEIPSGLAEQARNAVQDATWLLLEVLQAPVSGLVFAVLWDWFLAPFGLRTISPAVAVGLACLFSVVRCVFFGARNVGVGSIAAGYIKPLLYFGIGYQAHQYLLGNMGALGRLHL